MDTQISTEKLHKKRYNEISFWLNSYFGTIQDTENSAIIAGEIRLIDDAAYFVNDLYWKIANQYLRPLLATNPEEDEEHRIHQYKIVSATELAIMSVLPVEYNLDEEVEKMLNADFAFFASIQLLQNWETGDNQLHTDAILNVSSFQEIAFSEEKYPMSFRQEHMLWLSKLNVAIELPLIANAQIWRLFYLLCLKETELISK